MYQTNDATGELYPRPGRRRRTRLILIAAGVAGALALLGLVLISGNGGSGGPVRRRRHRAPDHPAGPASAAASPDADSGGGPGTAPGAGDSGGGPPGGGGPDHPDPDGEEEPDEDEEDGPLVVTLTPNADTSDPTYQPIPVGQNQCQILLRSSITSLLGGTVEYRWIVNDNPVPWQSVDVPFGESQNVQWATSPLPKGAGGTAQVEIRSPSESVTATVPFQALC